MTTYNKASLKTFFETNDIPTGQNYADLIDSQVNIVETARQDMAGALYSPEFATARVSAARVTVTDVFTIGAGATSTFGNTINAEAPGQTSIGQDFITTTDVFPARISFTNYNVVSAAGTTQATAALVSATINRVNGVVDGSTTGFRLVSANAGRLQYITNITNVSATLWPAIGQSINGLAANTGVTLAGNTTYTVIHISTSSYGVK